MRAYLFPRSYHFIRDFCCFLDERRVLFTTELVGTDQTCQVSDRGLENTVRILAFLTSKLAQA